MIHISLTEDFSQEQTFSSQVKSVVQGQTVETVEYWQLVQRMTKKGCTVGCPPNSGIQIIER